MQSNEPKPLPFHDPALGQVVALRGACSHSPHTFRRAAVALPRSARHRRCSTSRPAGVVALAAARTGAKVTAIDFSAGMVARVRAHDVANIVRQMDGQALDLPDAAFDAVVSVFGVMLFPDWRAGLLRWRGDAIRRIGGNRSLKSADGAVHLLLSQVIRRLYPEKVTPMPCTGLAEPPIPAVSPPRSSPPASLILSSPGTRLQTQCRQPRRYRQIVRVHAH